MVESPYLIRVYHGDDQDYVVLDQSFVNHPNM